MRSLLLNPFRQPSTALLPQFTANNPIQPRSSLLRSHILIRTMTTPSEPSTKRQKTTPPTYDLLYWPSIPGRGEYIRLLLEATSTPYNDISNASKTGVKTVVSLCTDQTSLGTDANPPIFSPPALRVPGAGKAGADLLIAQTPNILAYLAPRVGLVPPDEADRLHVQQLALTALDLSNEAHDTHHPVAVGEYYEDQKEEALRKARDFRANRVPKFLGYFERVLKGNDGEGAGRYLVGGALSYSDTTLWQVVDGLHFAFPNEMKARSTEFPLLSEKFYPGVKEEKGIKEYLASDRRLPFSQGLYRHYPELDRQE